MKSSPKSSVSMLVILSTGRPVTGCVLEQYIDEGGKEGL